MKYRNIFIALFFIITSVAITAPFVSVAASPLLPTCTYTATPSVIKNGLPTYITLHYTDSNAGWFEGTLFGGGITAYGTSGNQTVVINKATRYEMFVIDLATGNAHYCVASISSTSYNQP